METAAKDQVRFGVPEPDHPSIEIWVNGRLLADHAADVEQFFDASLAGSYAGLSSYVPHGIHHYLGRPRATWFDDGDTVLLGRECGEWGCWPLTAKVVVTHDSVRWSGFRTGHRDWDLSALGPFEFDRADYERALSELGPFLPE